MIFGTARLAAVGALALVLSGGAALAQPTLTPQGGSGNAEMDHTRMGGPPGQRSSGAPMMQGQGGGTGDAHMDHSRMGGRQGAGGGTPSVDPRGSGTGDAEISHPGAPGTGHGHEQRPAQRR